MPPLRPLTQPFVVRHTPDIPDFWGLLVEDKLMGRREKGDENEGAYLVLAGSSDFRGG